MMNVLLIMNDELNVLECNWNIIRERANNKYKKQRIERENWAK